MKKFLLITFTLIVFALIIQISMSGGKTSASLEKKTIEHRNFVTAKLPLINLELTTGQRVDLMKEERPVIINFWASWCTPCLKEFVSLNKLISEYGDKVLVVGINNDDEEPMKKILKTQVNHNLKFPSVSDPDSTIASKLNLKNIPATVVVYRGKAYFIHEGELDFQGREIQQLLKSLLR